MIVYDAIEHDLHSRFGIHACGLATWAVSRGMVSASDRVREAARPFAHIEREAHNGYGQVVLDLLTGQARLRTLGGTYDATDDGEYHTEIATLRERAAGIGDVAAILDELAKGRLDEIRDHVVTQEEYAAKTDEIIRHEVAAEQAGRDRLAGHYGSAVESVTYGTPVPCQATVVLVDGRVIYAPCQDGVLTGVGEAQ